MKFTNAHFLIVMVAITWAIAFPISAMRDKGVPPAETDTIIVETAVTTIEKLSDIPEETQELTSWEEIPLDAELQDFIVSKCEVKISPAIVFAMIYCESNYRADVIGDGGNSFGLMQIQPRWHSQRMAKLGCTDLLNAYDNVTVGIDYLSELLERYDGDIAKALTAYNRGHYAGEVTAYAKAVINEAERLEMYVLRNEK